MAFKGILPSGIKLTIERRGRMATFVYEETLGSARCVKAAADLVRDALPRGVSVGAARGGRALRISGRAPYALVVGMASGLISVAGAEVACTR